MVGVVLGVVLGVVGGVGVVRVGVRSGRGGRSVGGREVGIVILTLIFK